MEKTACRNKMNLGFSASKKKKEIVNSKLKLYFQLKKDVKLHFSLPLEFLVTQNFLDFWKDKKDIPIFNRV